MRKALLVGIALGGFAGFAGFAIATELHPIPGKHDVSEIRGTCSKVGGSFSVHADGGGYGCTKENCDGKGGNCIVACDNDNNCNGQTPERVDPKTGVWGTLKNRKAGRAPRSKGEFDSGSVAPIQRTPATAPSEGSAPE